MMALSGATTRKNTTALTLTDTLSREITSCGSTSMVTTRRSTRTICCRPGITITRPGPLIFQNRPSWNTTPRSYSRRMRNSDASRISTTGTRIVPSPRLKSNIVGASLRWVGRWGRRSGLGPHLQQQVVQGLHAHALPGPQRRVRAHLPALATDLDPGPAILHLDHLAQGANHAFATADHGCAARPQRHATTQQHRSRGRDGDAEDQRQRHAHAGHVAVEQQQAAGDEGHDTAHAQHAKRR